MRVPPILFGASVTFTHPRPPSVPPVSRCSCHLSPADGWHLTRLHRLRCHLPCADRFLSHVAAAALRRIQLCRVCFSPKLRDVSTFVSIYVAYAERLALGRRDPMQLAAPYDIAIMTQYLYFWSNRVVSLHVFAAWWPRGIVGQGVPSRKGYLLICTSGTYMWTFLGIASSAQAVDVSLCHNLSQSRRVTICGFIGSSWDHGIPFSGCVSWLTSSLNHGAYSG
ncbi:hypothetical protein OE88DRAFT_492168 [Heliocybe sulcata]|uniref:Uncharacterized protein n=1 Tax=Heliocybe sulcata TaxID=5364 RepID=A0A5C3MV67_9AGAM|nr:hypothetical protein OE88DRAFT_492168 [Heliocybe sulcata]